MPLPVLEQGLSIVFSLGSDRYLGPRDTSRLGTRDPSAWTVEDVMQFVRDADPQLGPHADLFRKHVNMISFQMRAFESKVLGSLWFRRDVRTSLTETGCYVAP